LIKYEVEEVIEDFTGSTKDLLVLDVKFDIVVFLQKKLLCLLEKFLASYAKLFVFDNVYIDKSVLIDIDDLVKKI
jgi:hypothetical protein